LRVATFNVRHGRRGHGGPVDVGGLVASCAALDADVLGLQDVDVGSARVGRVDLADAVARGTGMAVAFGTEVAFQGGGRSGNALLVRGTIGRVEDRPLPVLPPRLPVHAGEQPRCALLADIEAVGGRLTVAVCHLGRRREERRVQLEEVVRSLDRRPGPHLLLGDLGTGPWEVLGLLERAGFVLAAGDPTFPAGFPVRRLDHVAVRGAALGAVMVATATIGEHRPLVAEVYLDGGRPARR
jgi:endonuclease/exonuclease/phosphatase family metal-dependent hydrolase